MVTPAIQREGESMSEDGDEDKDEQQQQQQRVSENTWKCASASAQHVLLSSIQESSSVAMVKTQTQG